MTPQDTDRALVPAGPVDHAMTAAGQAANQAAAAGTIADYLSRKADNTITRQAGDLARFADFLNAVGDRAGLALGARMADFSAAVRSFPGSEPDQLAGAWAGVTWGLVEGFRNWMVGQGDAVGSINVRLSTVKAYAKLAVKAGALSPEDHAMIRTVTGYPHKEAKRVDERRDVTRRGDKKAQHVTISDDQARALKTQPDTPQGRRDAVIMAILLDHGLRVGELARLAVSDFDLKAGEMRFYRPKVDKEQTHKLTADVVRALAAWFDSGEAPAVGPLLRGSSKGGALTDAGMSEQSISGRVRALGIEVGLYDERPRTTPGGKSATVQRGTLSAHDCRHYWATFWAKRVDVLRLQEAGGWNSLAMPRRYVEDAKIANEGMA